MRLPTEVQSLQFSTGRIFDAMLAEFVGKVAPRHSETARDFRLGAISYFQRSLNHRFFERGKEVAKIVRLGNHLGELIGRELGGTARGDAVGAARRRHREILRSDLLSD